MIFKYKVLERTWRLVYYTITSNCTFVYSTEPFPEYVAIAPPSLPLRPPTEESCKYILCIHDENSSITFLCVFILILHFLSISVTERISEENGDDEDESTDEDDDTRTHFPESWIWTILKAK